MKRFPWGGRLTAVLIASLAATGVRSQGLIGTYPVAAHPPANPTFQSSGNINDLNKEFLGKLVFWEEQLSNDHTMSCGSCHDPKTGGNDKNGGVPHPGFDGQFGTPDDSFGSPGVVRSDANRNFTPAAPNTGFGFNRQATGLKAPTMIGAAFFDRLFWDMRAGSPFTDINGVPVPGFNVNAALETQASGPPANSVEMGHDSTAGLQWQAIEAKLGALFPLHLATNIPPTMPVLPGLNYQQHFDIVFGPGPITREKISIVIAAYMRTLIPNQAPVDLGTMTPSQVAGLQLFRQVQCDICHSEDGFMEFDPVTQVFSDPNDLLFSDGRRHNIGLVGHSSFPPSFQGGTKTPTLRNIGLHKTFFHSGHMTSLQQTMNQHFLIRPAPFGFASMVPPITQTQINQVLDFMTNALTDPRVAAGTVPFDFPTYHLEVVPFGSNLTGQGSQGTGGLVPIMIGNAPPNIGFNGWRLGLGNALPGATAQLFFSPTLLPGQTIGGVPVELDLSVAFISGTAPVIAAPFPQTNIGIATVHQPVPFNPGLIGLPLNWQWFVPDPAAAGGLAASPASSMVIF